MSRVVSFAGGNLHAQAKGEVNARLAAWGNLSIASRQISHAINLVYSDDLLH